MAARKFCLVSLILVLEVLCPLNSLVAQEKGTAAEYRQRVRSQQQAVQATMLEDAARRAREAKSLTERETALLSAASDQLNGRTGVEGKFHVTAELDSAKVGGVIYLKAYNFIDVYGKNRTIQASVEVVDIVDNSNAIVEYRPTSSTGRFFWLRGVDMKAHADEDLVRLDGVYAVMGTKSYETTDGGNSTLYVLEPVDMRDIADEYDRKEAARRETESRANAEASAAMQAEEAARREASFRNWKSADGKHTTEALLASYAVGIVTLERRDGKRNRVSVDNLSEEDRQYIETWRSERRKR